MELSPGSRLGPYTVEALIGAGGMGQVYRALDTRLGRSVALKVLPTAMLDDADRRERFDREARAIASLSHPHICALFDVGDQEDTRYLVMEFLEGPTLAERLDEGALPVEEALRLATQMAEALAAAHAQGVLHRDLKPANVMLTDGGLKLVDFGLAKLTDPRNDPEADEDATAAMLTRAGAVLGTMPYMSPEQVAGRTLDQRTDIFSFGVMLYEMATGARPFTGDSSAELTSSILRDSPPPPTACRSELPAGLDDIVARCLEKDPADRFATMGEVASALRDVAAGDGDRMGPARRPSRSALIAGAVVVLAGLLYGLTRVAPGFLLRPTGTAASQIRSIAVLPLDNYSGDPDQDYFAEGMTDAVTADLARISRIRVTSRGSAMQFKGSQRPATPEIAKILKVDAVVEGSVSRSGDRVRITAQLIDARADRHLWADTFERRSRDVLALQSDLAAAIAKAINIQLTPVEEKHLGNAGSVDPEAYDAYLKGRYFFNRPSDENLRKAIARYEDALARDPEFVPALSGLADAYMWAGYNEGFITSSDARPKAKTAVDQAIRLDPESGEARTCLANFKFWYEYDWDGSEVEFRRAFALNPSYAYAHGQFALKLAFEGRFAESIAESRRAMELDPLNPQTLIDAIFAVTWQGDIEAARDYVARAEELAPTYFFAPYSYGWIDIQRGRIPEAIPHLQRAKSMGAPAFVSAWLAYAYGASGDRGRAMDEVVDLKRMSLDGKITPFDNAVVALGLGDYPRAVSLLEQARALDSQWLPWLGQDRVFDPLREDPRFIALLEKLGFDG